MSSFCSKLNDKILFYSTSLALPSEQINVTQFLMRFNMLTTFLFASCEHFKEIRGKIPFYYF